MQNKLPNSPSKIRNFVNSNSIHKSNSSPDHYSKYRSRVNNKLYKSAFEGADKPELTCGSRAKALQDILNTKGFTNRLVQIYSDNFDSIQGHIFIEVLQNGKWIIQDPDFNIAYKDKKSKEYASLQDLVFGDLSNYIPCNGNLCGWKENRVEHLRDHYFEAYKIENELLLYNKNKFSPDKFFPINKMTFREYSIKNYKIQNLFTN